MIVLAGDVGGTNARLGLFRLAAGVPFELWRGTWPSRAHRSLEEILAAALPALPARPEAAAFGVAGPVVNGVCRATNLPWTVDERALASALGLARVACVNDLEANAWGLATLGPADLAPLLPGVADATGHRALVSAGTGLGEAGLFFDGARHHPFACEGGHADFAPADRLQADLWRWLSARHGGHVSCERVLSGPGLVDLARFLTTTPAHRHEVAPEGDGAAAALTAAAHAGSSALAVATVGLFASLYGAECGNVALKLMATGGVFVGGGIAPRVLPFLAGERFRRAFLGKGRLESLLARVPVAVVLEPDAALRGAAVVAADRA